MAIVARRAGLAVAAIPLVLVSLIGVFATRPLPCEGVACVGDDLRGSLLQATVFGVALAASVAAAIVAMFGRLKIGFAALAFSVLTVAVAILA